MSEYSWHAPAKVGHQVVVFQWSEQYGWCNECGLPAAFWLPRAYRKEGEPDDVIRDATKRCSVCAANDAADGNGPVRRIEDDATDLARNPYGVGQGGPTGEWVLRMTERAANRSPETLGALMDEVVLPHGRCDTCGAPCDEHGCTTDRDHPAAVDPTEPPR